MGALAFIKWAAETGNPIRLEDGRVVAWNPAANDFVEVDAFTENSLYIGEIGEFNSNIRNSVLSLTQTLTANDMSKVEFEVYDPGFVLAENNYFVLDRTFAFNGVFYTTTEVTLATKPWGHVRVSGRPVNVYKLTRDKGQADFGAISPTQFAANKAAEFGMQFFGQASPAGDPIIRTYDEDTKESTWEVLQRLAAANEFALFEANNVLFFASDNAIVAGQAGANVSVPSAEGDPLYVVDAKGQLSGEDFFGGRADLQLLKNRASTSIFPGISLNIKGLGPIGNAAFMVETVSFDLKEAGLVKVALRQAEEPESLFCTRGTYGLYDRGFCVTRIQQALGVLQTGLYGPYTEQKVKEFQRDNGITQTGKVGPVTWAAIERVT